MTSGRKNEGGAKPRPRGVLREDVNKESLHPRTFPWPAPILLFPATTTYLENDKKKHGERL